MRTFIKNFALVFLCSVLFSCKKDDTPPPPKPPVAEAGNDQNVQLPVSSFTLTGSGATTNGNIAGYLWSLVSGPNVPTIAGPSSASTSVSGFIAGTYVFQFLVRDDAGLTDVDTTTVIVIPSPIQTLTLQPDNNADERHIWGNNNGLDQSTHAPELDASAWTSGGDVIYIRGLLKFDLSSIPANATILTAKLSLYSNPTPLNGDFVSANLGTDNSMFIRRITADWVPSSTNWLNQPPATTTDQISIPHTSMAFLDLVDVDVKNLVVAMQSSGNYGFMIMLQNEVIYNLRDFCSSTYSDATKHPKLVVTYQ